MLKMTTATTTDAWAPGECGELAASGLIVVGTDLRLPQP
jgi:hypothetical protein